MKKYLHDIVNCAVISLGAAALAGMFPDVDTNECILCGVGIVGILYLLYSVYLLFFDRVTFDWYLLRENYIWKVIALVLYTPFVLALFYQWKAEEQTSKALIFEENLYKEMPQKDGCPALSSNLPDELRDKQEDPSLFWSIYAHYIDPGNQHMSTTPKGRIWAALIAILGVFLVNGLLVSSIIGWIDTRKEKWLKGEVKYRWLLKFRSHYVIIGGNDMVSGIVKQLFGAIGKEKPFFTPYILVQTSRNVEEFRRELFTGFTPDQQKRIIIYYGSRTSKDDIEALRLLKAKEVYILGEDTRTDDIESYHDTMNMECLKLTYEYLSVREPYRTRINKLNELETQIDALKVALKQTQDEKLRADMKNKMNNLKDAYKAEMKLAEANAVIYRVMFEYQTTFSVFQFSEISKDVKSCIRFKPFNYYEMWSQQVLINKKLDRKEILESNYLPLEGVDGIGKNDDRYVHLIIVGMSRMGVSMAIEAAHLAHYPNFSQKNIRTKITFIDKNAKEEKDFFMGRFKNLFALSHWRYGTVDDNGLIKWISQNDIQIQFKYEHLGSDFLDVEWEFLNGGVENPTVQEYISTSVNRKGSIVTIAVCLPEPSRCLAAALYLDREIYEKVNQVLVYNRYGDSLISQMTHKSDKQLNPYHNKLRAFGMSAQCYDRKMIEEAEFIAKLLGNKYDVLYEEYKNKNMIVDEGEELNKSDVAKWWSNIYAANALWTKLRFIKWDCKNVDSVPCCEAKWWSNIFYKIKEFCIKWFVKDDNKNNDKSEEFVITDEYILEMLASIEHARWNMEQLLLGYRPLTEKEQEEVYKDKTQKNPYKSKLAHFDICSYKKLKDIDEYSIGFDRGLSSILLDIYMRLKEQSKMSKS